MITVHATRGAVLLDRDGTINQEVGYIRELDKVQLIPGVAEAIRGLNTLGVPVIVVTNQSGVARGYYPETWLDQLHQRVRELLAAENAFLDAVYYCPHLPEGSVEGYSFACECRKPEPGLLLQAQRDFDLDLHNCFMIGDKATDVEVGQRVGAKTVLLRSGYGEQVLAGNYQHIPDPDYICDSVHEAWSRFMHDYFATAVKI